MSKKLIYLNNFPREDALKGQEFKGNSDLEKELKERGIIGDGEVTTEKVDESAFKDAKAKIAKLEEENSKLEEEVLNLHGFVEEAIALAKGTVPDGYEKV